MTAKQLIMPANRAFDSNGFPAVGATASLYQTGTLTPALFYSDAGLTQSLGSVITANSAGRFYPMPYQDDTIAFRLITKDETGAVLDDIDPFYFGTAAGITVLGTGMAIAATRSIVSQVPDTANAVYLYEAGYEGVFVFYPADHSAKVAGDPTQRDFIAPTTDPTGASGAWVRDLWSTTREALSANRTYYVNSTTGNDNNDGLTPATALLNIQTAINLAYSLDCNGYTVTIQLADGTYPNTIRVDGELINPSVLTPLIIVGNEVTPGNVIISTSTDAIQVTHGGYLCLKGVRTTTTGGDAWTAETFGLLEHQNCEHGNVFGICFAAHYTGQIKQIGGTYRCVGDADSFVHITTRSMVRFTGQNWGFSKPGGCNFTTYVFGVNDSTCDADGSTLSGSIATGRSTVHLNSTLNLAVADRTAFTSSLLGPGPWILGGDSNINLTEWSSLNIYIDPAGSDNNTGIGPESYNAFKTITGALTALKQIPFSYDRTNASNNSLLLKLANGTYAESVTLVDLPCWTSVKIVGTNGASNVTVAGVSDAFYASATRRTTYTLSAMTITATNAGCSAIRVDNGSLVKYDTVTFGACGNSHKRVDTEGQILNIGTTEVISGAASHHALAQGGGLIDLATVACTTTITGTPAFSGNFLWASETSVIRILASLITYSGSATGGRFSCNSNSIIDTGGGGDSTIPGNASGTLLSGGILDTKGGCIVLGQSAVAVSHTGDTTATVLATVTVPANSMGINGRVEIDAVYSCTGNTNNKTTTIKFGGTVVGSLVITGASNVSARHNALVANRGATNSQLMFNGTTIGSSTVALTTGAISTTAATSIALYGTLAVTTDTITLESYTVKLFPSS